MTTESLSVTYFFKDLRDLHYEVAHLKLVKIFLETCET